MHRVVAISELAGGAKVYIVHVSCEEAMQEVKAARERGLPVQGETCTQYLVLSIEDDMGKPGFEDAKYVFTPPLRKKKNQAPLWEAVKDDVLQVVSTDHCPFRFADQKTLGLGNFTKIPNGGPGIENRMQLGLSPRRERGPDVAGAVRRGDRGGAGEDLRNVPEKGDGGRWFRRGYCHLGPEAKYTITAATQNMHTDYSIFEGFEVKGNARQVFSRGELVVEGGKVHRQGGPRADICIARSPQAMSLYVEGPTTSDGCVRPARRSAAL